MQTAIQNGQQRHISRTGKDVIPGHNLSHNPDRKCPGTVEISVLPWYPYSAVTEDSNKAIKSPKDFLTAHGDSNTIPSVTTLRKLAGHAMWEDFCGDSYDQSII